MTSHNYECMNASNIFYLVHVHHCYC
jgi:hypothetical protein